MNDRLLDLDGLRVRYRVVGQGEPSAVFLHGIGRSLEDWEANLAALGRDRRAIALDLIGFGRSDKPMVPYSLPGLARFLAHALDALKVQQASLVGSSLGGAVAQQFAAMFPERVSALVLVGSAGFGPEVALALRLACLPGVGELLLRPSRRGVEATLRAVLHDRRHLSPGRIERELALARLPGAQDAYLRVLRSIGTVRGVRADWQEAVATRLRDTLFPTLLIWGRQDRILPVRQLEVARARFPHARWRVFERCGHFPQIEAADEFNALVAAFLRDPQAADLSVSLA